MVNIESPRSMLTVNTSSADTETLRIPGNFPSPTPRNSSSDIQAVQLAGRPRINKAGLIVTAELDQAILRCRSKVQKLANDCRRGNRRYRDIDFDLLQDRDNCLHGAVDTNFNKYNPTDALRVSQIFKDPSFFIDGATASDIAQGTIGDCWFLSALAIVATAGLIEQICVERDEKVGIYGFIFWRDSGWVDVIIDDLLFIKVPRWTDLSDRERMLYKNDQDLYIKEARKGSKTLLFGKSLNENETWVPLIEKAYAKLHGDYSSLEGGYTNEAVEDLTGAVSTLMYAQDILDADRFWTSELLNVQEDRAFACYTPGSLGGNGGLPSPSISNGLVKLHAYSVIKAVEFNGKRFLKVRNPWGRYEWTGRWSDGSKEWTGEWLEALPALDYKFGNDGEFIMEYSDFLQSWDIVEKCRLFDKDWACSQLWLSANLGTYPRPTNFGDVSFTFSLSKDTDAVIVLAQLDTRYFRGYQSFYSFSLHCEIFKKDEQESVAVSPHNSLWERSVNLEIFLEAGEYVVQVRIERLPPDVFPEPTDPEIPPAPPTGVSRRKDVQKRSEKLRSMSIAANFKPATYGIQMPITPETFSGMDLTRMELLMHRLFEEHRNQRTSIFGPPKNEPTDKDKDHEEGDKKDEAKAKIDDGTTQVDDAQAQEAPEATKPAEGQDTPAPEPAKKVHDGVLCNGCWGPVAGSRFRCLDVLCPDYDLCEDCIKKGGHREGHQMIEITDPDDRAIMAEEGNPEDESVVVGLRLYTNKDCNAVIQGQLRHGNIIRNYLTMSKII